MDQRAVADAGFLELIRLGIKPASDRVITGNVIDNGTLAFDRSDTVTFASLISGSGNLTQNVSDTTILTAGTIVKNGFLESYNGS
ncbi:MAG TPA: hypothetical protein VE860_14625 [Chthoniobacterales bacterium]|jgi:hypothetical protein|nr:hypothetical protein [Chthoniobacterales bacterium]